MKKIIPICVLFTVLSLSLYAQTDTTNLYKYNKFGINAGLSISRLESTDTLPAAAKLPFGGVELSSRFNKNFGLYQTLQFCVKGGETEFTERKYRLRYIDYTLMPEFFLGDYFVLRLGARYSFLFSPIVKKLNGSGSSGYSNYPLEKGYGNYLSPVVNLEAKFTDAFYLFLNYTIQMDKIAGELPKMTDLPYSNFQIGISYRPQIFFDFKNKVKYNNIPETKEGIQNITYLDLNNKNLTIIPEEVFRMKNLKKLVLTRNDIVIIPGEISKLENLEYISLAFNNVSMLSKSISSLKNLNYLDLRYNDLRKLPENLGDLENLEFLYLGHNNIREIPSSIGKLKNLKYLSIGKNNLNQLPPELFEINSLVELNLIDSGLMEIPDKLNQLRNLEILRVDFPVPPSVVKSNPRLKIIREPK